MEMHQVRYFLAVARELNFTRAAEKCNVAQPSLTRAIKQLEDEFGGELFRRERNLSHLTDLGQRMLPMLQQCYDSAITAKSLAQSIKSGAVAQLSVALSVTIDLMLFTTFLMELVKAFPGLELRFFRGTNQDVAEYLKKGDADVAIAGRMEGLWDRLDTWPIFREPYHLFVSSNHRLAKETTPVPASEISGERLLYRVNCDDRQQLLDYLANSGATPAYKHDVSTEQDVISLVSADLGIALAPRSSSCSSQSIASLELDGLAVERTVYVSAVAGRQRSVAASTFIKMLRAADWREVETRLRPSRKETGSSASAAQP
jgi:DNA-binding transcriptional LysR family regulator